MLTRIYSYIDISGPKAHLERPESLLCLLYIGAKIN